MHGFVVYEKFIAIQRHFKTSYDYFKYNGKCPNITINSYENRKDKFCFEKLAKKPYIREDLQGYILANILAGVRFGTDLSEKNYIEFQKRIQSQFYNFSQDIKNFNSLEEMVLIDKNFGYPKLITYYSQNKITLETLCIISNIIDVVNYWDKRIEDTIFWPENKNLILKYTPFIKYEEQKYKTQLKNQIQIKERNQK